MRTPEFGYPLPRRRPRPPPGVAVPVLGARPRASELPEHPPLPCQGSRLGPGCWFSRAEVLLVGPRESNRLPAWEASRNWGQQRGAAAPPTGRMGFLTGSRVLVGRLGSPPSNFTPKESPE